MENKKKAYGNYGKMKETIGNIIEIIEDWSKSERNVSIKYDEMFFLNMIILKLLRALKSNHYDSFLDLANYVRLECIDILDKDILDDLIRFRNLERMEDD